MISATPASAVELSDADLENLVKRCQYVALYNVNNKFALKEGGWNICSPDTQIKDHTLREIARPNNDSLYIICLLDLRKDPVILEMPAFDSKYVSLMITGHDHYVNIPMSTRLGAFKKPEKMHIYTARTEGYDGKRVEGIDRAFEATGGAVGAKAGGVGGAAVGAGAGGALGRQLGKWQQKEPRLRSFHSFNPQGLST
jgi:hypothetical protein